MARKKKNPYRKLVIEATADMLIKLPGGGEVDITLTPDGAVGTVMILHDNMRIFYNEHHASELCWRKSEYIDGNFGKFLKLSDPRVLEKFGVNSILRLVLNQRGEPIAIRFGE